MDCPAKASLRRERDAAQCEHEERRRASAEPGGQPRLRGFVHRLVLRCAAEVVPCAETTRAAVVSVLFEDVLRGVVG